MTPGLLEILRCPRCRQPLHLEASQADGAPVESMALSCDRCGERFPVVDGVARFVPPQTYADNFGLQWNRFRQTQLDSVTGLPISRDRFFAATGWTPQMLNGRRVLDVGCGAGRFAEIALSCGADVVAVDYSSARARAASGSSDPES